MDNPAPPSPPPSLGETRWFCGQKWRHRTTQGGEVTEIGSAVIGLPLRSLGVALLKAWRPTPEVIGAVLLRHGGLPLRSLETIASCTTKLAGCKANTRPPELAGGKKKTRPPNSRVGGSNSITSLSKARRTARRGRGARGRGARGEARGAEAKNGSFRGVSCGF